MHSFKELQPIYPIVDLPVSGTFIHFGCGATAAGLAEAPSRCRTSRPPSSSTIARCTSDNIPRSMYFGVDSDDGCDPGRVAATA